MTNTSAATAALSWMFAEWIVNRKPTVLGIASGVVAGLVAITPAAGFVDLPASLIIGFVAGVFGFFGVAVLKQKIGYDDSLDAFGVHGRCDADRRLCHKILDRRSPGGSRCGDTRTRQLDSR